MLRNITLYGVLMVALAFFGCSSSSKSATSRDGAVEDGQDSAGTARTGDGPISEVESGGGQADSARTTDGRFGGEVARMVDSAGSIGDGGGPESGNTRIVDAPGAGDATYRLLDGAQVIDVPRVTADLASPAADVPSMLDGFDSRAGQNPDAKGDTLGIRYDSSPYDWCDLGSSFQMPAAQVAVPNNYGVCMPPAGKNMTDIRWHYGMPAGLKTDIAQDGLNVLSGVITCTELSDAGDVSGSVAGTPIKATLAAQPNTSGPTSARPQRLFAVYEESGGNRVQAVYDLTFIKPEYVNVQPPYPERYFRLSPACGSADAIPFLKGWTGRIGSIYPGTMYFGPDGKRWSRQEIVLWGSAEGESGARALWFVVERAP